MYFISRDNVSHSRFGQDQWLGLIGKSTSSSTKSKRRVAWKHWMDFLKDSGGLIRATRPLEMDICLWLVYLSNKRLKFATIKVYLYSLNAEIKFWGGKGFIRPEKAYFISSTLKALRNSEEIKSPIEKRPLTVSALNSLISSLDIKVFDNLLFAVMLSVGVYGLFRINELCYTSKDGLDKFIKNKDVVFEAKYAEITIFRTKTDPVVKKIIASVPAAKWDPYKLLRTFKSWKTNWSPEEPFFVTRDGRPVKRQMLVNFLKDRMAIVFPKVPKDAWNGISLRKGGATSAMQRGVHTEVIKKLGNWKSTEYRRYVHVDTDDIVRAQETFAKTG